MTSLIVERSLPVDAAPGRVWALVSDLEAYADHVSALAETTVVSGADLGARRRCITREGLDWEETCVVWRPGEQLVVDVDVSTYPLRYRALFSSFSGTWEVDRAPEGQTVITIRFEGELHPIPGRIALGRRAERELAASAEDTLRSYAHSLNTAAM